LTTAGADAVRLPLLDVLPGDGESMDAASACIETYSWLVFSSSNAVEAFLPRVASRKETLPRLAVIGPATATAVRQLGFEPSLEASKKDGAGLAEALVPLLAQGARVLLPQADDARPQLAAGLRQGGADLHTLVAYRKGLPDSARVEAQGLFDDLSLGWVTFTSPRLVRHFVQLDLGSPDAWRRRLGELRPLSVGPVTSDALRHHGLEPAAEATEPTSQGMVEAMIAAVRTDFSRL
jgi:uroporphyrinogen-III synthase